MLILTFSKVFSKHFIASVLKPKQKKTWQPYLFGRTIQKHASEKTFWKLQIFYVWIVEVPYG